MPLTGLDIYKLLPKTNCKKCGFPTCLAFAMALAAKKTSLDKCPDITEEAKQSLASASEPPIRTVTFANAGNSIKLGGETVLFRHDKTFWNPCGLGIYLSDAMSDESAAQILGDFPKLQFERVGEKLRSEFIYIENSSDDAAKFSALLKKAITLNAFVVARAKKPEIIDEFLKNNAGSKLIIAGADKTNFESYVKAASAHGCPLVIAAESLDELSELTLAAAKLNFREIIIELKSASKLELLNMLIQIRRLALKKNLRQFGYPVLVRSLSEDVIDEASEAAQYIEKYASIVILKTADIAAHLALVSLRQNIYTDPQKPVAVEPKLYKFGAVGDNSPVLVTTNFSLTYYSVSPEIENSKVPCYLLVVDTDGMSVLTAWAADKFNPERINDAMKKAELDNVVKHKKIVIPGYVAVLSGKLNDLSGWEILVGPREATGIPKFLKTLQ